MPKTKYFAEFEGQTFTRNSDRTYTHVVIGRTRLTQYIDAHERGIKWDNERVNEYRAVIASGIVPAKYARSSTIESYKGYLEGQLRSIQERTQKIIDLQMRIDAGEEFDDWGVIGWCGRYDLAMKQCKYDENKILEVQKR